MQSIDITNLIQKAFMETDNKIRKENEAILSQIVEQNPDYFIQESLRTFANTSEAAQSRVLVGTVLKNLIQVKKGTKKSQFWNLLQETTKQAIKISALTNLVDNNQGVRLSSANLIAMVFVVDFIDKKQYTDILDSICSNISNENQNISKTSIQPLGSICEILSKLNLARLDTAVFNKLSAGICLGLNGSTQSAEIVIKALSDSIKFLNKDFENPMFADFIFNRLFMFLDESFKSKDWNTFSAIFMCFKKIIKSNYCAFGKYIVPTIKTASDCLSVDNEKALLVLTEFLIDLLKLENEKKQGYFATLWQDIFQKVLNQIFIVLQKEEDYEEE